MFFLVLLQLQACYVSSYNYKGLQGIWDIFERNKAYVIQGMIPGSVVSSLYDYELIMNPLSGFNDVEYRHILKSNWTFTRNFKGDKYAKNLALIVEGLDTVADIYINDVYIGNTINMFKRYIFDLEAINFAEINKIVINFTSPLHYVNYLVNTTYKEARIPPFCPQQIQKGECHANLIRKEQCSFSWDWGPAIPDIGIWKDIGIAHYNNLFMEALNVYTFLDADAIWRLTFIVQFYVPAQTFDEELNAVININFFNFTTDFRLESSLDEMEMATQGSSSSGTPKILGIHTALNYTCKIDPKNLNENGGPSHPICAIWLKVPKDLVSLWWPNGHGGQPLYTVAVTLYDKQEGSPPQVITKKIGFRTLELNQDLVNNENETMGRYFYFVINGRKIYAKGSNWIPASLIKSHISPAYVDHLLRSVRDANMNMLRVWGGGTYESDLFHDIADRYGILIWQDAMFACSLYPGDSTFLSDVADEIRYQAQRLQPHPSVVIWSSNNENELGIANYWFAYSRPAEQYKSEYRQLAYNVTYGNLYAIYNRQIQDVNFGRPNNEMLWVDSNPVEPKLKYNPEHNVYATNKEDTNKKNDMNEWTWPAGHPYESAEDAYIYTLNNFPLVISSPSNGILEVADIDASINSNPQSPIYGDMHFYNYYVDLWDWTVYPKSRFVSEYGFQALPSMQSLRHVAKNETIDLTYGSLFMNHRQHHMGGYLEILTQISRHFRVPTGMNFSFAPVKPPISTSPEFFAHFVYLSQIVQARAYQVQTEFYRRNRDIDNNGQGYNMGALYWQLNDVWAAPTWASIEYGGRWKMSHYYAKHFFAPILLSIHAVKTSSVNNIDLNHINVYNIEENKNNNLSLDTQLIYTVVCDLDAPRELLRPVQTANKYTLKLALKAIDSFDKPVFEKEIPIKEISQGATIVLNQTIGDLYPEITHEHDTSKHYYIHAQLKTPAKVISEQRHFLDEPKAWTLQDPELKITNITSDLHSITIYLTSKVPAFYVWFEFLDNITTCAELIESEDLEATWPDPILMTFGTFSDNGITIDTPKSKIKFEIIPGYKIVDSIFNDDNDYENDDDDIGNKNSILLKLHKCFTITTLFDTYQAFNELDEVVKNYKEPPTSPDPYKGLPAFFVGENRI